MSDNPMMRGTHLGTEVLSRVIALVLATFLFGYLGHLLGKRIGAEDVLALAGAAVGALAGFYSLYVHLVVLGLEARHGENEDTE